jgi:colanic acid/amylovoran biosynthesis glycosyltransferase
MRIAYLVTQYPAASHTFIRREVEALRAHGLEIRTLSVRKPSEAERSAPADRAAYESTFYVLPPEPARLLSAHLGQLLRRPLAYTRTFAFALQHRVPGLRALLWSVFHFGEAIVVVSELEKHSITHVHNHFANSGANIGLLAARMLGLPWSVTIHGNSETDYPAGVLLPEKLRLASFVSCVSYYGMAQSMRLVSPDIWSKFKIVRCGLDLSVLPPRKRTQGARTRVICVGRLSAEKGQAGLLEAFAAVRARGHDAELVLVGDGPDRERVERRIAALGLGDSVRLLGRLPEPQTLAEIAASDVLVLASFIEGLPVVFMEAMAIGVAVIGPRVAGVPELIDHGNNGLLFAPANWPELAERLEALLSDSALRERLAAAGRAAVEAGFEIHGAVAPIERYFRGAAPASS